MRPRFDNHFVQSLQKTSWLQVFIYGSAPQLADRVRRLIVSQSKGVRVCRNRDEKLRIVSLAQKERGLGNSSEKYTVTGLSDSPNHGLPILEFQLEAVSVAIASEDHGASLGHSRVQH